MNTKYCYKCKKCLSMEKFKTNTKRKDGLQSQCVDCQKEYRKAHYLNNRKKYIDKTDEYRRNFIKWWKEYKKGFKCAKCSEAHPACIQFHHPNDDKEKGVSVLINYHNKNRILKEISKCIPLCANCHFKEHWKD